MTASLRRTSSSGRWPIGWSGVQAAQAAPGSSMMPGHTQCGECEELHPSVVCIIVQVVGRLALPPSEVHFGLFSASTRSLLLLNVLQSLFPTGSPFVGDKFPCLDLFVTWIEYGVNAKHHVPIMRCKPSRTGRWRAAPSINDERDSVPMRFKQRAPLKVDLGRIMDFGVGER